MLKNHKNLPKSPQKSPLMLRKKNIWRRAHVGHVRVLYAPEPKRKKKSKEKKVRGKNKENNSTKTRILAKQLTLIFIKDIYFSANLTKLAISICAREY